MAGILDKKSRIIDFIITDEGRRQISTGQLRAKYASFTDCHTFYEASGSANIADDGTDRLFFEATDRFQDTIVPELEAGREMRPFRAGDVQVKGKSISSGTLSLGFSDYSNVLTGSALAQKADNVLTGLTSNFTDQRIVGTNDPFSETTGFSIQPLTRSFVINKNTPFQVPSAAVACLETIESMFQDRRLAHLPNFKFLPPKNAPTAEFPDGLVMGNYLELNQTPHLSFEDLQTNLKDTQKETFIFDETSRENNLLAQIFEVHDQSFEKLSIIDFGVFDMKDDAESPGKHVYFVGKVERDANGTDTFINMFTLVFD